MNKEKDGDLSKLVDDDVVKHVILVELHDDDTVYKIHSDYGYYDDDFQEKLFVLEDYINDMIRLNNFYIDPFKIILNCHIVHRTKQIESSEKKEYPKECKRCNRYIEYDDRFKACIDD